MSTKEMRPALKLNNFRFTLKNSLTLVKPELRNRSGKMSSWRVSTRLETAKSIL